MSLERIGPDHYRYYATLDEDGVHVQCERFVVIGETKQCYYVITESMSYLASIDWKSASAWRKKLRKRVLKASFGRRYCYPDKAIALHSFQQRQKWRVCHAHRNLAVAELALSVVNSVISSNSDPEMEYMAGHNEYTSAINWQD